MLRVARPLIVVLLALAFAGVASPAVAAQSAWSFVDVTLQYLNGQSLLLVGGELPEGTPLPYEGELAVPAGSQLLWIGEILGGPTENDPQVQYVKRTEGNLDIYTFTLTQSRVAQAEVYLLGGNTFDGQTYTSALKWQAWQDLPEVRVAHQLPRGAQITQASESATMQAGDANNSYYAKKVANVKAGDVLDLSFAWKVAPVATGGGETASSGTIAYVIVGGAAVLLLGLLFFAVRSGKTTDADEDEADEAPLRPRPAVASAPTQVEAEEEDAAPTRRVKPAVVLAGLSVLVAVAVVVGMSAGSPAKANGGVFTKDFGAVSPCSSTSLAVVPNAGVDLAKDGSKVVDSFLGQEGVGVVTLDTAASTMKVEFCTSSQTEDSVRQIVANSGLVTVGGAAPSAVATPTPAP